MKSAEKETDSIAFKQLCVCSSLNEMRMVWEPMTRHFLDVCVNDTDDNDGDGSRTDDDVRDNVSPIFPVWWFSGHPLPTVSQCILSFLIDFLDFSRRLHDDDTVNH